MHEKDAVMFCRAFPWALLVLMSGTLASAGTLIVPDEYSTIQAAIDGAAPGDSITVLAGTYTGPGNRDLDFGGKDLILASEPMDPTACIIDCGGSAAEPHRGFWFHNGESSASVVRGFTITGGYDSSLGGGVLIGDGSATATASFEHCIITANEAPDGAGLSVMSGLNQAHLESCAVDGNLGDGMLHSGNGLPPVSRCTFNGNAGHGFATTTQAFIIGAGQFSDCEFDGNGGDGLHVGDPFGRLTVTSSRAVGNSGWGVWQSGIEDGIIHLANMDVIGNQMGGIFAVLSGGSIDHCLIENNNGHGIHTNPGPSPFFVQISHTMISGNAGWGMHLTGLLTDTAMETTSFTTTILSHCTIRVNGAGGMRCDYGVPVAITLEDNLVYDNQGPGAELSLSNPYMGSVALRRNTLAGNHGVGILAASALPCTLQSNLVAFNQGAALEIQNPDSLVVLGNDHFGNSGGDWVDAAASLPGLNGNFSANPLFIAPELEDFQLAANSPCLPGQHPDGYDAGQIGAEPVGGPAVSYNPMSVRIVPHDPVQVHPGERLDLSVRINDAAGVAVPDEGRVPWVNPGTAGLGVVSSLALENDGLTWNADYMAGLVAGVDTLLAHDPECTVSPLDTLRVNVTQASIVESVLDIPEDQGLQVRIIWRSACADTLGAPDPVTFYTVWRRVPEGRAGDRFLRLLPFLAGVERSADLYQDAVGTLWEPAGPSVPAMLWARYSLVCPTLHDSTDSDPSWAVFQVSAHHVSPQTFSVSWPDSGRSVDDLAPDAPSGLVVALQGTMANLSWIPATAPDLVGYHVYGLPLDAVNDDQAVLLASTAATTWLDPHPQDTRLYWVRAYDDAGKVSNPAFAEATAIPQASYAQGIRTVEPNPFNPRTRVAFFLPYGDRVRVAVYDTRGHQVRLLLDENRDAGDHFVAWDGRNALGRNAPSGVYLIRVETTAWRDQRAVTLLQ